jgi:membrane-associated protease RseP (regulator of RpoE activity)
VTTIDDGSVAALGGLRAGDHIVSVDGQLLTEPSAFNTYIAARPTSPLKFVVLRDGKQETVVVHPAGTTTTTIRSDSRPALGLRFAQSAQVIVAETVAGGPAAAAGLLVGDQIITVNGEVVTSSDQFITLVAAAPLDQPLTLGYVRGSDRSTVSITPAAWDTVFASTGAYTTLKPVAPETTVAPVVTCPAYAYPWYNPYYISNVSPVVVPLSWYGYYPYGGYAYWNYPYYYGYYPGYFYYGSSAYWNAAWPYGPRYGGPYPGPVYHVKPASELDSAGRGSPSNQQVARSDAL